MGSAGPDPHWQAADTGTFPAPSVSVSEFARIACLAQCRRDELDQIARFTALRTFPAQTTLFARGDACGHLYGLLEGTVRLVGGDEPGDCTVLDLLDPGALFGEQALVQGTEHECTAVTSTPCRVLAISALPMRRLLLTSAGTANALLVHMSARIGRLLERVQRQGSYSAEQQVAAFLLERSDPDGLLPQTIASGSRRVLSAYLLLRPETLSRVISRFRREGWLRDAGPGLQQVDRDALCARLPIRN